MSEQKKIYLDGRPELYLGADFLDTAEGSPTKGLVGRVISINMSQQGVTYTLEFSDYKRLEPDSEIAPADDDEEYDKLIFTSAAKYGELVQATALEPTVSPGFAFDNDDDDCCGVDKDGAVDDPAVASPDKSVSLTLPSAAASHGIVFELKAADSSVDRAGEVYTEGALKQMAEMAIGKPFTKGINGPVIGKVFNAKVEDGALKLSAHVELDRFTLNKIQSGVINHLKIEPLHCPPLYPLYCEDKNGRTVVEYGELGLSKPGSGSAAPESTLAEAISKASAATPPPPKTVNQHLVQIMDKAPLVDERTNSLAYSILTRVVTANVVTWSCQNSEEAVAALIELLDRRIKAWLDASR